VRPWPRNKGTLLRRHVQMHWAFVTPTPSAIFLAFALAAARELADLVLTSLSRGRTLEIRVSVYVNRYPPAFLAAHPSDLFAAVTVFHGQMEEDPFVKGRA
jgi:hypothetical protein